MHTTRIPALLMAFLCYGCACAGMDRRGGAWPQRAVATGPGISLEEARAAAATGNPLQHAASHQIESARANLAAQRSPLNPTVNFAGLNNTVGSIDFGNLNNYGLNVTLETSGRQQIRAGTARALLLGTEADAETTRLTVRQTVTAAYIDLQTAQHAYENDRDAYDTAKRLSDLTDQQFRLGSAPETNAIRAQIALVQADHDVIRAGNALEIAKANLNLQMGRPPQEPISASDPLEGTETVPSLEALLRQALENRPELRSAEASRRALAGAVNLQRSQYYPDVVLGTSGRFDSLQMGFALPLADLGSIRGSVRKAREDVKVQDAQIEQMRQSVRMDVQGAYLNLAATRELVSTFQTGIVPRAESLLKRIEQGYKLGGNTILDLIDAEQTYRTTRNDYYAALGDHRRALNQLERAIGGPLPKQ